MSQTRARELALKTRKRENEPGRKRRGKLQSFADGFVSLNYQVHDRVLNDPSCIEFASSSFQTDRSSSNRESFVPEARNANITRGRNRKRMI